MLNKNNDAESIRCNHSSGVFSLNIIPRGKVAGFKRATGARVRCTRAKRRWTPGLHGSIQLATPAGVRIGTARDDRGTLVRPANVSEQAAVYVVGVLHQKPHTSLKGDNSILLRTTAGKKVETWNRLTNRNKR